MKRETVKKPLIITGAILIVLVGIKFGIIGGLLGAVLVSWILKKYKIVSPNSALVKETKGVKIAKYVVLGLILLAIISFVVFVLINK